MPTSPAAGMPPAVAPFGRRILALLIDWLLCELVAAGLFGFRPGAGGGQAFWPLAVFVVENIALVSTLGSTVGHRLLGLVVTQARPGFFPLQVAIRTVALALVVPAIFTASDGRGFHDVGAGTRIVHR